jgi:predicted nuclease of predicted toxin-antitoxin system
MRFLIDRCAGRLLAEWLRNQGHNVVESRELGPDPGDRVLLDWAAQEARILVTIDTDFGELIYLENVPHAGLIRLPDVPSHERQLILQQ